LDQAVTRLLRETFSSLSIRNYRLYSAGQASSLCGNWMQSLAQAWLVLLLTDSGTAVGLVLGVQKVPVLLLGAWGGVVADRFGKRRLLYATQSASALLSLSLGLLVAYGAVQLWMVYVIALLLGLVQAVDNPTRQAFVGELVGPDFLRNAVALNSTLVNGARILGPALAALLIAQTGIAACFLVNALSYAAVLFMLTRMREAELHVAPPAARGPGLLTEGLRYVRANPVLRDSLLMLLVIGTLTYEFPISLPLLARFTFGANADAYAALMGSMGAGAVLGGLFAASRNRGGPLQLAQAAVLLGLLVTLTALMPTLQLVMAGLFAVGFVSIQYSSLTNSTLQLQSDPSMRGRVMALWSVAFVGSTPIGGPLIGWVCEHVGPRWGLGLGGAGAVLAGCLGAWRANRRGLAPAC
jgi:MFS family permease